MESIAAQLKRGISRQFSSGSLRKNLSRQFTRQASLDPRRNNQRFSFGRQSSLDPIRRSPGSDHAELTVPENLDSTMQLLFMACRGDVRGVEDLLNEGIDVNSIDLDGRTALHIAACEGHVDVARLLLTRKANLDARDRWGSTAAADAKYYGNTEIYYMLKARGAKVPKTRKTPMTVANPREVPEYELNPLELQVRKSDGISKGTYQVAKWNGTKVAVKILDKDSYSDPDTINAFKHELTLLERVRHPNVVQFVGAVTQNIPMMIVREYHSKGDLATYLQKKGRLSPTKVLRFALDIARQVTISRNYAVRNLFYHVPTDYKFIGHSTRLFIQHILILVLNRGMNYLHECKPDPVIHCDLKPKNILLDNGGQLKIAGFGTVRFSLISPDEAKLVQPESNVDLSSLYLAPEVYRDEVFDRSADAYSFGLIVYEPDDRGYTALESQVPGGGTETDVLRREKTNIQDQNKKLSSGFERVSLFYLKLIEECWDPAPVVRPTFSQAIVRLDKICANCSKQGRWKDTFKLPWYVS
ncbi:Serine/threonine-protein kinase CTR1, partial [Mucuna pruriens]